MEAQAAGLRIVTSSIAALNETVGPRGHLIPGDWLSEEYQKAFLDYVVLELTRPEGLDRKGVRNPPGTGITSDQDSAGWEQR